MLFGAERGKLKQATVVVGFHRRYAEIVVEQFKRAVRFTGRRAQDRSALRKQQHAFRS